jgi:hypothetical protein
MAYKAQKATYLSHKACDQFVDVNELITGLVEPITPLTRLLRGV